jgi:hypothetical protein
MRRYIVQKRKKMPVDDPLKWEDHIPDYATERESYIAADEIEDNDSSMECRCIMGAEISVPKSNLD